MALVRAQERAQVLGQGKAPAQERGRVLAQEPVQVQGPGVAAVREAAAAYGNGADRFCCPHGSHLHRYRPSVQAPMRGRG